MGIYDELKTEQARAYRKSVKEHIHNVGEAGKEIGVLFSQLSVHDRSKFTVAEFMPYAKYFFYDNGERKPLEVRKTQDQTAFKYAWLHHLHHNPHHWEHWIIAGSKYGVVLEMPENFALEMIADWMGASKTYTGSWDMSDWLIDNLASIIVHAATADYLRDVLRTLGYLWIFDETDFAANPRPVAADNE